MPVFFPSPEAEKSRIYIFVSAEIKKEIDELKALAKKLNATFDINEPCESALRKALKKDRGILEKKLAESGSKPEYFLSKKDSEAKAPDVIELKE